MTERKGSRILLTQTDRFKRQFISPITERSLLQQTSTYPGSGGEGAARTGNDVSSKASKTPLVFASHLLL